MKEMIILMVKMRFWLLVRVLLWVKNLYNFNREVLNMVGIVKKKENLVVM